MLASRQRIQILGTGGVGLFLSKELNCESNDISFIDSRPNSKFNDVHAFRSDGSNYEYPKKVDFCENVDWNFVCTKSYDITDELVVKLSNSKGHSVFIQNGKMIVNRYNKPENKFIFANFASLDVQVSETTLHVKSRSPEILFSSEGLSADMMHQIEKLFQLTCIQVKFFQDYNAVLSEKFPRWLLTSLLTIYSQESIGFALKSTDKNELEALSNELARVLSGVLEIQIDLDSLLKQVASLPPELTTSSYRDYFSGNQCEFLLEMTQLVESAHYMGITCPSLDALLERL